MTDGHLLNEGCPILSEVPPLEDLSRRQEKKPNTNVIGSGTERDISHVIISLFFIFFFGS